MRLVCTRLCVLIGSLILALSGVCPGSAHAQSWSSDGYRMSALSYDSLGFQVLVDDETGRGGNAFDRILQSECSEILQRNGICCVRRDDSSSRSRYPVIVIDVTVTPVDGARNIGDELYYGSITFRREVTLTIADRPQKAMGATWSMTFGGGARTRMAIVSDIEARLMDFLEDYLKLNSAKWIWKQQ